eukprot:9135537-Pyramimonas_sp.AAC.2
MHSINPLSWQHDGMAAGPRAPAAHRGARTAPTRPQGQGTLLRNILSDVVQHVSVTVIIQFLWAACPYPDQSNCR